MQSEQNCWNKKTIMQKIPDQSAIARARIKSSRITGLATIIKITPPTAFNNFKRIIPKPSPFLIVIAVTHDLNRPFPLLVIAFCWSLTDDILNLKRQV